MVATGWGPAERGVVSSLTHGDNRLGGQQREVWSAVECMVATGLGPAERGVVSS